MLGFFNHKIRGKGERGTPFFFTKSLTYFNEYFIVDIHEIDNK